MHTPYRDLPHSETFSGSPLPQDEIHMLSTTIQPPPPILPMLQPGLKGHRHQSRAGSPPSFSLPFPEL